MDRDLLKGYLDRGLSLEEIGRREDRHPSTIAYWLSKHTLVANGQSKHASRGGLARGVLEPLVAAGLSQRAIAAELGVSQATVKHWLGRYGLKTQRAARPRRTGPQPPRIARTCRRHGKTEFVLEGRGAYRCCRCRSEAVSNARRRAKRTLVEEAGGRCLLCGYDRYFGALQFHHLEPEEKLFALSRQGITRGLEAQREEAEKCALVCANCHAEIEGGVIDVPVKLPKRHRPS